MGGIFLEVDRSIGSGQGRGFYGRRGNRMNKVRSAGVQGDEYKRAMSTKKESRLPKEAALDV
jgi:hypothetical protein